MTPTSPLPPLPLTGGALFVDNSGWMEGMSTCYRYLEYKSLRLRIPASDKPSLNFGSAIHLALEFRYSRYGAGPVGPQFFNELAVIFQQFFGAHPTPADDWRTINWAVEMMKRYMTKYDTEGFNLLKPEQPLVCPHCHGKAKFLVYVPEGVREGGCLWCGGTGQRNVLVEMSFSIPLFTWTGTLELDLDVAQAMQQQGANVRLIPGTLADGHAKYECAIPIIYTGRIDLPILLDGDSIWVNDHKTTSAFEFNSAVCQKSFWEQMKMSAQQKGYCWAFKQLTGKDVAGYMINGIRTASPPQYVLNGGESTRLTKEGGRKTAEQWWDESLQRERYTLKPTDLNEWKFNTISLVNEFFTHYQAGYMPMKTAWCTSYGRCPYFQVCELASEDRLTMLQSGLYMTNEWSPLNQPSQAKQ